MREIKSKLGGSPGDNVKIFIKVVTPQTFLGLRQSPSPGSVPLSPPHLWPHGDKQHSSAVIDLIGFLLKLLYFVQSSRKKQCTNLNTLRPKNSYTVFLSSPVSRATKFCSCYCFNKGKLHKPAPCPTNGSTNLIVGSPWLISCYSGC